jgi:hypothetical protein
LTTPAHRGISQNCIKYKYKFTMDNNIAKSIKHLRENTTFIEFDDILNSIKRANDLGDLDRYLDAVVFLSSVHGLNPAEAFQKAMDDLVSEP